LQEEDLVMKLKGVLVAAALLAPTAALAAPGMVTASVGLRAGPGPGFPIVDRIPDGSRVNIHGCLRGHAWCDVSWTDDRGWVSAQYLEYLYRNHYVYLPDYVDEIDVPVVPFVLSSYWSTYYAGRPWYHRRAHWNSYWTAHQREAYRMRIDPRAARIGRAATRDAAAALDSRTRVGANDRTVREQQRATREQNRLTREQTAAPMRNARENRGRAMDAQARMMRENRARTGHENARAAARAQPMAQPRIGARHEAPRISAAPAARPAMPRVAQPNVRHGSPMNARAQMPAPRPAAPAMPHGGGAPHVNAAPAPHIGGGAPAGGPPGHKR
jgi:uncharacterized protein YraI